MELKKLIEEIAKVVVDDANSVAVQELRGEQVTILELRVSPKDLGRVIGKLGRTAHSLRIIVSAAGMKLNRRIRLEIVQ